jgi:DNA-binding response OmpR family regulator
VDQFESLADAQEALRIYPYDLLLLVLNRPGKGVDLIRRLRRSGSVVPIIIVTAHDDLATRVSGLDTGADDYLVTPLALLELVARCRAVLRRSRTLIDAVLLSGNISLEPAVRRVQIAGAPFVCSVREASLLELLLRQSGQIVTRRLIEDRVYCHDEITPNAIEALVSRLRRKLKQAGATSSIRTARGIGYSLSGVSPDGGL